MRIFVSGDPKGLSAITQELLAKKVELSMVEKGVQNGVQKLYTQGYNDSCCSIMTATIYVATRKTRQVFCCVKNVSVVVKRCQG